MMSKKFLFAALIGFLALTTQTALAAGSLINITPENATKIVGENFDLTVGVVAAGSRVYAVEGKVILNNLTCQSIAIAEGITVQTSPSCANTYFLLGIPSGTTAGKNLFTMVVKAGVAGSATASFSGVDLIGEGVSLGSQSTGGAYTLNKAATTPPAPIVTPPSPTPSQKNPLKPKSEPIIQLTEGTTTSASSTDSTASSTSIVEGDEQVAAVGGVFSSLITWIVLAVLAIIIFGFIFFRKA